MKTLLNKILLVSLASLALWSCKKDETRAVLKTGAAPTLAASKTTLVLNQSAEKDTAVVFTWNNVDYGFQDAMKYSLQISKAGTNFASATTTEIGLTKTNLRQAITVGDLNRELNKILPVGVASSVEARLKSDVNGILSNVVTMTVTPYKVLILYGFPLAMNVAGSFQNWTPQTAPQIVSIANDQKYEGFIDFGAAAPEFKFVKGNDWPFGDYGTGGAGLLGSNGNLSLPSGGMYLITADTKAMTWTNYKITSWGIIGDAVPVTGWDSDQNMTYDATSKTYKITLDLIGGKAIKFRANDDWATNLGGIKDAEGKLKLGGDNITVPVSGNYTVTLDILVGGNWAYTLKKN